MTDEHNFGTFTQAEVDDQIEQAVRAEQGRAGRLCIAMTLLAYACGLMVGVLVR